MTPGDLRSLALRAVGYASDTEVDPLDASLVNDVERALVEAHNSAVKDAARVIATAPAIELKADVAKRVAGLAVPEFA